jgi:hypothetical protein
LGGSLKAAGLGAGGWPTIAEQVRSAADPLLSFRPEAAGRSGEIWPRTDVALYPGLDVSIPLCFARHDECGLLVNGRHVMFEARCLDFACAPLDMTNDARFVRRLGKKVV